MALRFNRASLVRLFGVALFALLAVAGIAFSLLLFLFAKSLYDDMIASIFLLLSLLAAFFDLYSALIYSKSCGYADYFAKLKSSLKPLTKYPTVAIVVPVFNEDPNEIKSNMRELLKINYPKEMLKYYILDDSTDLPIARSVERFAQKHQIVYIRRKDRKGFKAGAINNMANTAKEEFFAIFDADERLVNKNFLINLMPFFQDPRVSYVQTDKRYETGSTLSGAMDITAALYYKFVHAGRALNNTAIFAGSCGIVRKSAFEQIGGFPEYVVEDTFFSFESNMHNFKSVYVPEVYALGRPLNTFTEVVKQQWRYNYGNTQFFNYYMKKKSEQNHKKLPFLPSVDYFIHGFGLNYASVVLILFTLATIGVIFSTVPFIHIIGFSNFMAQSHWLIVVELMGLFAFVLPLLMPAFLSKFYFNSLKSGVVSIFLNYALAFVRVKAALATLINKNPGMHWNKLKTDRTGSNVLFSLRNTYMETTFASAMLGFSYLAYLQSNIFGSICLAMYGILYLLTTIFLYKYG